MFTCNATYRPGDSPFVFRKPPIKDWLLAYVFNALTNGIIDKFIVTHGLLRYPTRLLKKQFRINVLFDFCCIL
ncbi:CBO0543 family protein [Priestia megaterium]